MRIVCNILYALLFLGTVTAHGAEYRDIDFGNRTPLQVFGVMKVALGDYRVRDAEYRSRLKKRSGPGYYDPTQGGKLYAIDLCHNDMLPDINVKSRGPQYAALSFASYAMELEKNFKAFGVPAVVWQPYITKIDQVGIDSLASSASWRLEVGGEEGVSFFAAKKRIDSIAMELLKALKEYRAQNKGKPQFRSEPECGAGEDQTEVIGNAALVTFSYIPYLNFRICELVGAEPENQGRCSGWASTRFSGTKATLPSQIYGVYRYLAKMPGGVTKRGEFYASGPTPTASEVIHLDLK